MAFQLTWVFLLSVVGLVLVQVALGYKDCAVPAKDEKSMFRVHSGACQAQAPVDAALIDSLLRGEVADDPSLKKHVYCILLKCKVISKDGKLHKTPMFCKSPMSNKTEGQNMIKTLESCSTEQGETPEETAWMMLRCSYEKKIHILDYLPTHDSNAEVENSTY